MTSKMLSKTLLSKFIAILILFISAISEAQEFILIQAPGASPIDFIETAKNTKGVRTIVDLQIEKIQTNASQEEKLFTLGEQLGRPASELIQEIEILHRSAPLTQVSLSFLADLSEKVLTTSLKKPEASFFKDLSCQSQFLTEEVTNAPCKTLKVDLPTIRRQWPQAQALLIESQLLYLNEQNLSPEVLPERSYHWTLLANSAQSISFYGTYDQFLQQRLVMENFIEGTCEGFSTRIDDFQLNSKALIFFSKDCTKRVHRPIQKTQFANWMENNQKWVYPLSGLLVGGAIFAAQGKTLVIDKP
ncbi:hypothetical protein [Bdellovibrio svalbardensis]|uniref:Uncharacterized protein n=1 Tax=Bdellovibrio svalbardensis TaxID=2972972 RepID=A0ABT6DF31_9BACT|nr:hypothetical protein [Bdellovibrio svalbardensis]MDG0815456.1 hypothetical protein [Bdellovibrio svalbardensis]